MSLQAGEPVENSIPLHMSCCSDRLQLHDRNRYVRLLLDACAVGLHYIIVERPEATSINLSSMNTRQVCVDLITHPLARVRCHHYHRLDAWRWAARRPAMVRRQRWMHYKIYAADSWTRKTCRQHNQMVVASKIRTCSMRLSDGSYA
jgi:hypothetical protein